MDGERHFLSIVVPNPDVGPHEAWERLGNPGWNWKNFLKYSIKSEKCVSCSTRTEAMETYEVSVSSSFIPPSDESVKNDRLTYNPKVHGSTGETPLQCLVKFVC